MAAIQSLCSLIGIDNRKLSRVEFLVMEIELFSRVCSELKNYFCESHKSYFRLLNFASGMENDMLEANLTKLIIKDILLTNEYTVEGLAYYAGVHIDVINDVMTGLNINPSASLLQRVIELHRSVRKDIYHNVIQKIMFEHNKSFSDAI